MEQKKLTKQQQEVLTDIYNNHMCEKCTIHYPDIIELGLVDEMNMFLYETLCEQCVSKWDYMYDLYKNNHLYA